MELRERRPLNDSSMSKPTVTEETKRQLDEMFLPELHQTWWAEQLAQLQDQQDVCTDPSKVRALESRIREHYETQHDIELTRTRLGLDHAPGSSA